MLAKLTSRKFWVSVLTIITGILGVFDAGDSVVQLVSSVGLILIPAIIYVVTEGKIDAAAVTSQIDTDAIIEAVEEYMSDKDAEAETETTTE